MGYEDFNGWYIRRSPNYPIPCPILRQDPDYTDICQNYPWYEKDDWSGNYIYLAENNRWYIVDSSHTLDTDVYGRLARGQYCCGTYHNCSRDPLAAALAVRPDVASEDNGIPAVSPEDECWRCCGSGYGTDLGLHGFSPQWPLIWPFYGKCSACKGTGKNHKSLVVQPF